MIYSKTESFGVLYLSRHIWASVCESLAQCPALLFLPNQSLILQKHKVSLEKSQVLWLSRPSIFGWRTNRKCAEGWKQIYPPLHLTAEGMERWIIFIIFIFIIFLISATFKHLKQIRSERKYTKCGRGCGFSPERPDDFSQLCFSV